MKSANRKATESFPFPSGAQIALNREAQQDILHSKKIEAEMHHAQVADLANRAEANEGNGTCRWICSYVANAINWIEIYSLH